MSKSKSEIYYKSLEAAFDIKGDMGLPDDDYREIRLGFQKGYETCAAAIVEAMREKCFEAKIGTTFGQAVVEPEYDAVVKISDLIEWVDGGEGG